MSALGWIWHWLTDWWPILHAYGAAGLWIAGLVAAAVLIPWLDFKVRVGLVAVAGVIVLTTISFSVGIKLEHDRCAAAQARAEQERKDQDRLQAAAAASDADRRLAEIVEAAKSTQEQFDAYKLANHRTNACRLTLADRRGMRLPGDPADPEICRATPAGSGADAAGACATYDRDAKDALADTRLALAEANMRLAASAAWYAALRKRYGAARLR